MNNDVATVTIAMTAFNAEHSLDRALHAATNQVENSKIQIIEVLVYDDASTDKTCNILHEWAQNHPKITPIVAKKNGGVGMARQRLISQTKGDFVVFMDDDDLSVPERTTLQIEAILRYEQETLKHPAPVFCFGQREQKFPNGETQIVGAIAESPEGHGPSGQDIIDGNLFGFPQKIAFSHLATCALAGRTKSFIECGNFDPTFRRAEDSDLTIKMGLCGAHIIGTSTVVVTQWMTKGTDKSLDINHQFTMQLLQKYRHLCKNNQLYPFLERWQKFKYSVQRRHTLGLIAWGILLILKHPLHFWQRFLISRRHSTSNAREAKWLKSGCDYSQ